MFISSHLRAARENPAPLPAAGSPSARVRLPLLLLLFALALSAAGALRPAPATAASASPLDALVAAQKGIDKKDSDLFNRSVDVESVALRASDTLLAFLRARTASGDPPAGNLGMLLALAAMAQESGQAELVRQLLVSEVKSFVAAGINGGYFAGTPDRTVKLPKSSLAATLPKIPKGRREITAGKVLAETEGKATVSAAFVDPGAGRLPLELALERKQGRWRVVEIINARSLFEQALERGPGKN
jgi:hypothetical protein